MSLTWLLVLQSPAHCCPSWSSLAWSLWWESQPVFGSCTRSTISAPTSSQPLSTTLPFGFWRRTGPAWLMLRKWTACHRRTSTAGSTSWPFSQQRGDKMFVPQLTPAYSHCTLTFYCSFCSDWWIISLVRGQFWYQVCVSADTHSSIFIIYPSCGFSSHLSVLFITSWWATRLCYNMFKEAGILCKCDSHSPVEQIVLHVKHFPD